MRNFSNSTTLAFSFVVAAFCANCSCPAVYAGDLVGAGQFGDTSESAPANTATNANPASTTHHGKDSNHSAKGAKKGSSFFAGAASPLTGGVSVIDHVKQGGMRLKRATIPLETTGAMPHMGEGPVNNHNLPLTGSIDDGSMKFQSLFPSLDGNSGSPKSLSGNAQQDKPPEAPKGHPIWQKSPFGGYYDASGNVREVIKGNQLYKYGGTMADGLTPAPSGPVEQNSMGYIKWQPLHGGPPGWY